MPRDPHNALVPRIQQHIERLVRSRTEVLDDVSRKRSLAEQQAAAYGDAKRPRLGPEASVPQAQIPPLAPGQPTLASIFTLTRNPALAAFRASQVPLELAARITVSTLAKVDPQLLVRAASVSGRITRP